MKEERKGPEKRQTHGIAQLLITLLAPLLSPLLAPPSSQVGLWTTQEPQPFQGGLRPHLSDQHPRVHPSDPQEPFLRVPLVQQLYRGLRPLHRPPPFPVRRRHRQRLRRRFQEAQGTRDPRPHREIGHWIPLPQGFPRPFDPSLYLRFRPSPLRRTRHRQPRQQRPV